MRRGVCQILFVLLTIRLLLPPGICVCQWHSPAARYLASLFNTGKEIPPPPPAENEDDHEPGCPASKLAAGMGLRPATQPIMPPADSAEVVPVADRLQRVVFASTRETVRPCRAAHTSLYVRVCALLI
jgi:hypothetical protein